MRLLDQMKALSLRRRARRLREDVRRAEDAASLPGGVFGTYWASGIEGREEARRAAGRSWDVSRDLAAELEARAIAIEQNGTP